MNNDFDDDDSEFLEPDPDSVAADRLLGLVVPPRARVIRGKDGRTIIHDELTYLEERFRKQGGLPVTFWAEDWSPETFMGPLASRRPRE
jgi:hypothetical protein